MNCLGFPGLSTPGPWHSCCCSCSFLHTVVAVACLAFASRCGWSPQGWAASCFSKVAFASYLCSSPRPHPSLPSLLFPLLPPPPSPPLISSFFFSLPQSPPQSLYTGSTLGTVVGSWDSMVSPSQKVAVKTNAELEASFLVQEEE